MTKKQDPTAISTDPLQAYMQGVAFGISVGRRPVRPSEKALIAEIARRANTSRPLDVRRATTNVPRARGRPEGSTKRWPDKELVRVYVWILRRRGIHGMSMKAACEWLVERGVKYRRKTLERMFQQASVSMWISDQQRRRHPDFPLKGMRERIATALKVEIALTKGMYDHDPKAKADAVKIAAWLPLDPARRGDQRAN